jgi:class 3 adenylate cyclase
LSRAPRILVVDDEPDVEALVSQHFRREIRKGELEFVFAHDGKEALDMLGNDPDVLMVLSDINMPRMDGLTLLSHLEERHEALKTVVVSAYGDMDNIRTAMNRGAFDFVTKPIDFSDLETTIRKTLSFVHLQSLLQKQKSEAELARASLSRYFSPSVAAALSSGDEELKPGGKRQEATFLFTDLQGFTPLVESLDSKVIVALLNGYLDGLAKIIFKHEGTVMKVVGDDYTAYGDAVNTAARLETANKTLGTRICISESVVSQIEGFRGRPAGDLQLAGKTGTLSAFEPLTAEQANSQEMKAYCEAYELLKSGDDGARQAFAGLLAIMPDDPLALFHLQRALAGKRDVVIDARR